MATLTGNSKKREARLQDLMLTRLANQYQRRIRRSIASAMSDAAKAIESGDTLLDKVQAAHSSRMEKELTSLWKASSKAMYSFLFGEGKSIKAAVGAGLEPTITANAVAADFIRSWGADKVTQVTSTTIDDIKRIVTIGISEGWSEREIAKAIRDIAPTKSASRAQTIARTETHASAMYAAQETAASTGVEMRREWVTAIDDRTRETHRSADGQVVGMNEAFDVGGSRLMYPGDPSGPADEVINCRCAVVFLVD